MQRISTGLDTSRTSAQLTDLGIDSSGDLPLPLPVGVLVDQRRFSEDWPARTIVSLSVAPDWVDRVWPVWRRS